MEPVSVCTPTYNNADQVEIALDSVSSFADEIVVLDSNSTDGTREIVNKYEKTVLYDYEFEGFAHMFRTAAEKASNDWVLFVDADEEVGDRLAEEIRETLSSPAKDAYKTSKRNQMWGKWMHAEHKERPILARKEALDWDDSIAGEEWIVREGFTVGELNTPIFHYAYDGIDEYIEKWMRYTSSEALDSYRDGRSPSIPYFYLKGIGAFGYRYLYEKSILDGWQGLFFATMSAIFYPVVDAKIRQLKRVERQREDWEEWWVSEKC